jgi:predicted DNA binding protein
MGDSNTLGSTTKVLIHIPSKLWLSKLSLEYPECEFSVLSAIPVSLDITVGNTLIKISCAKAQDIFRKISEHPSINSVSIIEEVANGLVINVFTKDESILDSIVKSHVVINFPVNIKNGIAEFVLSGLRTSINSFFEILESKGVKYEIKILGKYVQDKTIIDLTPRQLEIYYRAQEEGYYDVPRRITLTELAVKLDLAKSTLSSMLQRVHKKLIG